jgi:hypothetical protein
MIRRMTVIFGVCGFLIAVLLGITWKYLIGHTSINPHSAPLLSDVTDWLWPTSLMLMALHDHGRWSNAVGIFISAMANGLVYSLVGVTLGMIIKMFAVWQQRR